MKKELTVENRRLRELIEEAIGRLDWFAECLERVSCEDFDDFDRMAREARAYVVLLDAQYRQEQPETGRLRSIVETSGGWVGTAAVSLGTGVISSVYGQEIVDGVHHAIEVAGMSFEALWSVGNCVGANIPVPDLSGAVLPPKVATRFGRAETDAERVDTTDPPLGRSESRSGRETSAGEWESQVVESVGPDDAVEVTSTMPSLLAASVEVAIDGPPNPKVIKVSGGAPGPVVSKLGTETAGDGAEEERRAHQKFVEDAVETAFQAGRLQSIQEPWSVSVSNGELVVAGGSDGSASIPLDSAVREVLPDSLITFTARRHLNYYHEGIELDPPFHAG